MVVAACGLVKVRDVIAFVAETGSTNADLAARVVAGEDLADGFWLVADRQVAGHGRMGRAWLDGAGNFMGSTVVRARPGDPPLHTLALVAGLALHAVVASIVPHSCLPLLKWPNDVMIGQAKLAGILLERTGDAVIVGIGVNLARAPEVAGRETVAISRFGPAPDRDLFARQLADAFAVELGLWRSGGLASVIARWLANAHPVGTPLLVGEPGEIPEQGHFCGLDPDGALILRRSDGTTQTVHAGEVRLGPAH